jgi:hypothetical protein
VALFDPVAHAAQFPSSAARCSPHFSHASRISAV